MPQPEINCLERQPVKTSLELHPGWIRVTAILLLGVERLRRHESGQVAKNEEEIRR